MKSNRDNYTLEDIQKECAIMFTEKNLNADFSRSAEKGKPLTAGIAEEKAGAEINPRYGVLLTK